VLRLVLCEPTGSSFSTPGFTPDSLPVLFPIPDLPQSHSIALIQGELLIVSTKHRSRSHSTLSPSIALLRRGPWVRVPAGSALRTKNRTFDQSHPFSTYPSVPNLPPWLRPSLSPHPFPCMGKDGVKEWSRTLINIRDCAQPALRQLRSVLRFSLTSVSPRRAFRTWARLGPLSESPRPVRSFVQPACADRHYHPWEF
jgi:hypothetical protein